MVKKKTAAETKPTSKSPSKPTKSAPKKAVKTEKTVKKRAIVPLKQEKADKKPIPAKKPAVKPAKTSISSPKPVTKASKPAPAKKAAVKTASAPMKAFTVKNSKDAMDSFKKTLNEAHKKGFAKLSVNDRKALKKELQTLRDRVVGEIEFLTDDSLNKSMKDTAGDMTMHGMHMADHGTDNFDREFALNLVSAEHDVLYEIDDALRRIDEATYGICEECGCQVEKARLEALPFARLCVRCKSEKEKGSVKYRPLGPTLSTRS